MSKQNETTNNNAVVNFLLAPKKLSLGKLKSLKLSDKPEDAEYILFQVKEITYEEDYPRKEALDNVLGALQFPGINFVYLIIGDELGVHFYLGVSLDQSSKNLNLEMGIEEVGIKILKPSIEGHFRGSKLVEVEAQNERIEKVMRSMNHYGHMEGVPAINEKDDANEFQGVDRLVDVMTGDSFYISIVASSIGAAEIDHMRESLFNIYDQLSPLSKISLQQNESSGKTTGHSESKSLSQAIGTNEGESDSQTKGKNKSTSKSTSTGSKSSTSGTDGSNNSKTKGTSKGSSITDTQGSTVGKNESKTQNSAVTRSSEYSNRRVQSWIKYLDDILLPRLNYGINNGLFCTNISIGASDQATLAKLDATMKALFLGDAENNAPLQLIEFNARSNQANMHPCFQFPVADASKMKVLERDVRVALSQPVPSPTGQVKLGNWLSSSELSLIAGLPRKEVVGLTLKKEVEFGLNPAEFIEKDDRIPLGHLVRSGNELNISIDISRSELNKHVFISGVTGSGKTTTCHKILLEAKVPFLVIEPAKTEYRILKNTCPDLLVFTLGNDSVAPFRLNPFEFFPHENISSRVDMIKACIEAAFDMEAAIPQIIESAIYRSYEDYGWNISSNTNSRYEDPFADGVFAFPTLGDLIRNVEVNAKMQGFDDRLMNDYIGSIKARLQGLLVGAKGAMLNTRRSINFKKLIQNNVVLELEEIRNGAEKSLIMGFVLINLNEALKASHREAVERKKNVRHITLVEEAHRLLSKFIPGDSPNKKLGVETFSDMLAEVRKYGESLIIVDQIPNKLTPDVLKNTNTKIIHRIFSRDDKEAIGGIMALEKDQIDYFSYLETGRAIVSSTGFIKPMQVKIEQVPELSTTQTEEIPEKDIRESALRYYQQWSRVGIIPGLSQQDAPSIEMVDRLLKMNQERQHLKLWEGVFSSRNKSKTTREAASELHVYIDQSVGNSNVDIFVDLILEEFYLQHSPDELEEIKGRILEVLLATAENMVNVVQGHRDWLEV